jgi:hypothetical protein
MQCDAIEKIKHDAEKHFRGKDYTFEDVALFIIQALREYQNNPASLSTEAQPASMGLHAAPADAQDGGGLSDCKIYKNEKGATILEIPKPDCLDNTVNQTGAEDIEIGDIVQFFAASHPLNKPTEYIGRVERDYKGLHAANRYLPIKGVRIIEKGKIK